MHEKVWHERIPLLARFRRPLKQHHLGRGTFKRILMRKKRRIRKTSEASELRLGCLLQKREQLYLAR